MASRKGKVAGWTTFIAENIAFRFTGAFFATVFSIHTVYHRNMGKARADRDASVDVVFEKWLSSINVGRNLDGQV
jgi:hypothetical protein